VAEALLVARELTEKGRYQIGDPELANELAELGYPGDAAMNVVFLSRGRVLSMKAEQCPECGERSLRRTTAVLTGRRKGESFPIRTAALVCSNCQFKTIPEDSMGQFARRTADAAPQVRPAPGDAPGAFPVVPFRRPCAPMVD
jgi:predicted nucleic-acid-binding Zn-ribbon protein